jgi:hypothetical protein
MSDNFILDNIDKPQSLEEAYRKSPELFEADLKKALLVKENSETLNVWHARLSYLPKIAAPKISTFHLIMICSIAGFFVKIPSIFDVHDDWYYSRFAPIITISAVISYFIISTCNKKIAWFIVLALSACISYLLVLPDNSRSASITMALIHLPLFTLSLLAVSFMSDQWINVDSRINFIRYLGEMGIYSVLILLGGIILTALTLGLFSLIDLPIDRWYMEYVVVIGLVSSPVVATYLFDSVQNRQSKFAPILSNVFSPLFLITILAYLIATVYQGKSPYTDRDFLITFNWLLIVILALTIFSISGKRRASAVEASDYINICLIGSTLIVNLVALSAILFRWAEYGVTLNRIVVSGANILIFIHLVLLLSGYIGHIKDGKGLSNLESIIARYMPIYAVWSLIVSFVLPLVFQFE